MNKEQIVAQMKELMAKQQGLLTQVSNEKRNFTAEETGEFDNWQQNINSLQKQIEFMETVDKNTSFMNQPTTSIVYPTSMETQAKQKDNGGFKNFGEFICAVRFGDRSGRLGALETKDMDMRM